MNSNLKIITQSAELALPVPDETDAYKRIERTGRVCYQSQGDNDLNKTKAFIERLIALGHESVLEHQSFTFHIITSRGVSHELVRHRLASYTQESTRYCNYESCLEVIEPSTRGFNKYEVDLLDEIQKTYSRAILDGLTPQEARGILPNCTKTEIYMTMNVRELRHFLKLRLSKKAHPDIQELARMILNEMKINYPVFVGDIVELYE